jgi:hypothetical protein
MIGDCIMAVSLLLLLLLLIGCDIAEMPPCSAVVVIGSVTYSCPRLPPPNGK